MKDSEVFLKAAELMVRGGTEYCCIAIDEALGIPPDEPISKQAHAFWEGCFQPTQTRPHPATWYTASGQYDGCTDWQVIKAERVLALCFAAAMAETGDI